MQEQVYMQSHHEVEVGATAGAVTANSLWLIL